MFVIFLYSGSINNVILKRIQKEIKLETIGQRICTGM